MDFNTILPRHKRVKLKTNFRLDDNALELHKQAEKKLLLMELYDNVFQHNNKQVVFLQMLPLVHFHFSTDETKSLWILI